MGLGLGCALGLEFRFLWAEVAVAVGVHAGEERIAAGAARDGPGSGCAVGALHLRTAALRHAAGSSPGALTLLIPILEPSRAGFTISGIPSAAATSVQSASLAIFRHGGVAIPTPSSSCLVRSLSMLIAEPSTPEPVYGAPINSSAAWT